MDTVNVKWMTEGRSKVTHGFVEIDLRSGFVHVEPIAPCGVFTVADLHEDETADRCTACERGLLEMLR